MTTIEIFRESGKQTHEDLFLDNASRRKNLKDMKGFDMAICSVDFYAWLSCKGQNNKKTQSLLQDKKSTANYPFPVVWYFLKHPSVNNIERLCCEHRCRHAAQLSRQKSRCFTTALATAHHLPQLVPLDTMLLIFWRHTVNLHPC